MNLKKFAFPLMTLALLPSCIHQPAIPQLSVRPAETDLGAVPMDSTYQIRFALGNTGSGSLLIDTVTSSCGCSLPRLSKKTVRSGDSAVLLVDFRPPDTGRFEKVLVIRSNSAEGFTVLKFRGSSHRNP